MVRPARWTRLVSVAVVAAGFLILLLCISLGGWRWTASSLVTISRSPATALDRLLGSMKADRAFDPERPRIYCDRFLGQPLGLYDPIPDQYEACGVSFWRVQDSDPRGIKILRSAPGPEGGFNCVWDDPYSAEPPEGLPEWADQLTCRRDDGTERHFAVVAERLPEDGAKRWMQAYNRRTVELMSQGE